MSVKVRSGAATVRVFTGTWRDATPKEGRVRNGRAHVGLPRVAFEGCDAAVRRLTKADPREWTGDFAVHCTGKTGELLFLSGAIPSLRKHLPKARLLILTQPHYERVLEHCKHRFDVFVPLDKRSDQLAEQVALHHQDYQTQAFVLEGNRIVVNCYRAHGWSVATPGWPPGSFYQCFTDAIGAYRAEYEKPGWDDGVENTRGEYVLALPSLNYHSSPRRILPVEPHEWKHLADVYGHQGLACFATGHAQDPKPSMPGWTWIDCDLIEAMHLTRYARATIAGNSGMAFIAGLLSRGRVLIIDESPHRRHHTIALSSMRDTIPADKGIQLFVEPSTLVSRPWIASARGLV